MVGTGGAEERELGIGGRNQSGTERGREVRSSPSMAGVDPLVTAAGVMQRRAQLHIAWINF